MSAPVRTVSSHPLGGGGRPRGGPAELIMKMIFIKVGPCCETARGVAVSMPKMRRLHGKSILNSGKRRTAQW